MGAREEDTDNKMRFAEPLVQLMTDCKLGNSNFTAAAIERRVKNVVEATSIVTLYKAVITAAELKEYLERHGTQIGLDEGDSKAIANFLWEARAQVRAGDAIVWMSSSLQLGWPVLELAEALGINPTRSCSYIRYKWLVPTCAETRPPGSHS